MAFYLTVVLLSVTLAFTHAEMKIDSRCPMVNGNVTKYLPHETSCAKYYVCDTGMAITLGCPQSLLWNAEKNICDFSDMVECKVEKVGKIDNRCPKINGEIPVFLGHETQCNQYYVCDWGFAILMSCPPSQGFDDTINTCSVDVTC